MAHTKPLPFKEALYPKFQHNCRGCKFITGLLIHGERHDLYICVDDKTGGGSVVYRYGDDGPEYSSFCTSFIAQSLSSSRGEWGELALELAGIIADTTGYPDVDDIIWHKPQIDVRVFSDDEIRGTADPFNALEARQRRVMERLQRVLDIRDHEENPSKGLDFEDEE